MVLLVTNSAKQANIKVQHGLCRSHVYASDSDSCMIEAMTIPEVEAQQLRRPVLVYSPSYAFVALQPFC